MKANEAPERIHVQPNAHDKWFEGKIPNGLPNGLFVEYTRTDAFIEKTCEFIAENMKCDGYTLQTKAKFIKHFRTYMEE